MAITLLTAAPYMAIETASANRYTADAFGMITGVPIGHDLMDLVAAGAVVLGYGPVGRNNVTATVDPVATNDNTQDYFPGSIWVNSTNGRAWTCVTSGTGTATWALAVVPGVGIEPATNLEQFGGSTATMLSEGNIYRLVPSTPTNPASTGNDNVLANYALPANAFDGIGNRMLFISATGTFAANANTKEIKLWIGATTATVGSAIVGGTCICDSGASAANGAQWELNTNVAKYGAANSNTQRAFGSAVIIGAAHSGFGSGASALPQNLTLTENAVINISVTGNATTTATDIALIELNINAMN
jgi:hypothetical protein